MECDLIHERCFVSVDFVVTWAPCIINSRARRDEEVDRALIFRYHQRPNIELFIIRQIWVRAALKEKLDKIAVAMIRCQAEHSVGISLVM